MATFRLFGVTFERNSKWHKHVATLTTSVTKKLILLVSIQKENNKTSSYTKSIDIPIAPRNFRL